MAKRFAYASFGVLCLIAAYQTGAERAHADWDWDGSGEVVGVSPREDGAFAWTRDGKAWVWIGGGSWGNYVPYDLPVPATEVKLLSGSTWQLVLATLDGRVYVTNSSYNGWVLTPSIPGGPITTTPNSWGQIKSDFAK